MSPSIAFLITAIHSAHLIYDSSICPLAASNFGLLLLPFSFQQSTKDCSQEIAKDKKKEAYRDIKTKLKPTQERSQ